MGMYATESEERAADAVWNALWHIQTEDQKRIREEGVTPMASFDQRGQVVGGKQTNVAGGDMHVTTDEEIRSLTTGEEKHSRPFSSFMREPRHLPSNTYDVVPWKSKLVAFILIRDGAVRYDNDINGKRSMIGSLAPGDILLMAWPGMYSQDIFTLDENAIAVAAGKL